MNDIDISLFSENSLVSYIINNLEKANKREDILFYYNKVFDYAITYINDIQYDDELKYRFENILKCYEGFLRLHGNVEYMDYESISIFDYSYTFSDAINMLRDVLEINSDDKSVYFLLGICYESKKQYNDSIENYKMSLKICKENWTYYWLSRCFYRINMFDESLECLDEILSKLNDKNIKKQYLDVYELKSLVLQKQNKYKDIILNAIDAKKFLKLSKTLLDDVKFSSIKLLDKLTNICAQNYDDKNYESLLENLLQCFDIYYILAINEFDFRNYIHYIKVSYEYDTSNIPFSNMLEYKDCIDYIRELLLTKGDYKNLFNVQLKINYLNNLLRFPGYIDLASLISNLVKDIKPAKFLSNKNKLYEDHIYISSSLNSPILPVPIEDKITMLIDILDECYKIEPENKYLFLFVKAKLLQDSKLYQEALNYYSLIIEENLDTNKIDEYLLSDDVDDIYMDIALVSLDEIFNILNIIHKHESTQVNDYLSKISYIYDRYIQYILKDKNSKYDKIYLKSIDNCDKMIKLTENKKELQQVWKLKREEIFFNYVKTHICILDCEANFIYDPNSESIISRYYNFENEGLKLYDELIKLNPNNPIFYYYKGNRIFHIINIQKKRNYGIDLSHFTMNKSKNKNAKNPTTERLKSVLYYIKNKDFYDEMLSLYIKAYELDKTNELFINSIIVLLEEILKYNEYIKNNEERIKQYIK